MDAFPPNSRKAAPTRPAPEAKRVEQVTSAEAQRRKKPVGRKFRETFLGDDSRTTLQYVIFQVMIPAMKDMMVDSVNQGIERRVYGESRGARDSRRSNLPSSYGNLGRVNYQGMGNRAQPEPARQMSQRGRQQHDFGEIQVASRVEANDVLDRMYDLLSKYEYVTVADLYSLTGIAGNHVDQKWGWTSLRGASSRRTRSGDYVLDLPNPEYLDE